MNPLFLAVGARLSVLRREKTAEVGDKPLVSVMLRQFDNVNPAV